MAPDQTLRICNLSYQINISSSQHTTNSRTMSFTHHVHHHGHAHHDDDRSLTILYATETGNAQDTADRIAAHLRSIHMNCRSHDIGEYPLVRLILLSLFFRNKYPKFSRCIFLRKIFFLNHS